MRGATPLQALENANFRLYFLASTLTWSAWLMQFVAGF